MPFKIIRNDITKVKADAIVNTANPEPVYAGGTDFAVYTAAGAEQVLKERKQIGPMKPGEVAVTGAYRLDAKYIIHTVGPSWTDGSHGEFEILRRCYTASLEKALELGCESVAFPLISTGVYGFPKEKALEIAVSAFSSFLPEHEMQIILAVFDKESFQISARIMGEIDSYIDANYVVKKRNRARGGQTVRSERICRREIPEKAEPVCFLARPEESSLEEKLGHLGMSFHDKLFELIDREGLDNREVWKRANLDRKHFSKIQCDSGCRPKKKTVMALCIALHLNLEEARDLLARADWAFRPNSKVDLIVQKAITDKQYDIFKLNVTLFKYTNETLGV